MAFHGFQNHFPTMSGQKKNLIIYVTQMLRNPTAFTTHKFNSIRHLLALSNNSCQEGRKELCDTLLGPFPCDPSFTPSPASYREILRLHTPIAVATHSANSSPDGESGKQSWDMAISKSQGTFVVRQSSKQEALEGI